MKTHFIATLWLLSFATSLSHAQYLITTEAGGGGSINASSNGAKANGAFVGRPSQLAVDASGNVYLPYGSMLLEISPAGILTFAAGAANTPGSSGDGGPAANALLSSPSRGSRSMTGATFTSPIRAMGISVKSARMGPSAPWLR